MTATPGRFRLPNIMFHAFVPITRAMLTALVVLGFVFASMALGLFLAKTMLDFLLLTLGVGEPPAIRWQVVTFTTVLFWSWYFAPRLLALN